MASKTAPTIKETKGKTPDPAPRGRKGGWKHDLVADLRENPGKKVTIEGVSPSVVSHLKKLEPKLEVVSRNSRFVEGRKTRIADIYAEMPANGTAKKPPAKKAAAKK